MKTTQHNSRKKPPYGPNIVRAWFDTVFHYALRGLDMEWRFMAQRNWTFRFNRHTLEYIAPIAEHVPARDNLEQFLSFFAGVKSLVGEHDHEVGRLLVTCSAFHTAIVKSPNFRRTFESVEVEAPTTLGSEFSSHFGAYGATEDFAGILAEYLVNNVANLPSHYSTSRLWNTFRDRFIPLVDVPELAAYHQATEASGRDLIVAVDRLTSELKQTRSELSLEFDAPFVAEITSAR
jgi:hypothetical protein